MLRELGGNVGAPICRIALQISLKRGRDFTLSICSVSAASLLHKSGYLGSPGTMKLAVGGIAVDDAGDGGEEPSRACASRRVHTVHALVVGSRGNCLRGLDAPPRLIEQ